MVLRTKGSNFMGDFEQNNPKIKPVNRWRLGVGLILILICCSTIIVLSRFYKIEPITATVTELSLCKSVDENHKPIETATTFSPETKRIFVCGYLRTINPLDIQLYWYYENKLFLVQAGKDINGYFSSVLTPDANQNFPEGTYRVEVQIGGTRSASAEFRVE